MASVTFNGNTVDPTPGGPRESRDATNTNYIYVQGHEDLTPEQKLELEDTGVQFQEYLGDNAYLCRYEPSDLAPIRSKDSVRAANAFHRTFKLAPDLKESTQSNKVDIVLHKHAMSAEDATPYLDDVGISSSSAEVSHRKIRVEASPESLAQLQNWESVKQINLVLPTVLFNNLARNDMYANLIVPANNNAGDGQIVSVNDTGFDKGGKAGQAPTDVHPAFTGRIKALLPLARSGQANDPDGHGTHVCGSVAGNGSSLSMGGTIQGTAPSASLVVTSLLTSDGGLNIPGDIYGSLFKPPYNNYGARISTNSFGIGAMNTRPPKAVAYNGPPSAVDGFVWDNKDAVILFAAGNDAAKPGAPPAQIGDWASAKNCITVGATFSSRPSDGYNYVPSAAASNPRQIAPYSSKGPTVEGRIKPDVVAPGSAILSTCSRDPAITDANRQDFGPTKDNLWKFSSGTSMATPLVAGCCAALRQAVIAGGTQNPSAALIKALLINGALSSQEAHDTAAKATSAPDGSFGFGYVDISRAVAGVAKALVRDESVGLTARASKAYTVTKSTVATKSGLKATLVYSDRAGAALQNKLTLSITSGDSTVTDTSQKVENNVQQIIMQKPSYPITLTVKAVRIAQTSDSQPFALVWQFIE